MRVQEFELSQLFKVNSSKQVYHANTLSNIHNTQEEGTFPYVVRSTQNNGIRGYIKEDINNLNSGNSLSFAQDTFTAFYQEQPYFTGNKVKILKPKCKFNRGIALYIIGLLNKALSDFTWGICSDVKFIEKIKLILPVKTVFSPDYALIENLAGGGIDMSNIDTSTWKKFKLGELFDIEGTKTTPKTELELSVSGKYPYITTQATNNGIAGYSNKWTEKGGCLTVDSAVLGTVFYQSENFTASDHVEKLIPKFEMSEKMAIWFQTILQRNSVELGYSYQKKRSQKALAEETILLPCKETEEIDFEYMENYISELEAERISELEAERISELEAYLKVTGLDDYELTEVDKLALTLKPQLKEFKVEDIFEKIETTKLTYKAADYKDWSLKNGIPATTSGLANQGLTAYVPRNGAVVLKNCITIASNGDAGTAFYQPEEFTILQDSYAIQYKNNVIQTPKAEHYLYAVAALNKGVKPLYSYTNKAVWNKVKNDKILLPCAEGKEIDFDFMEKYIRAKEKQTIVKVYEGSGKIIEKTKEIVSDNFVVSA